MRKNFGKKYEIGRKKLWIKFAEKSAIDEKKNPKRLAEKNQKLTGKNSDKINRKIRNW